LKVRGGADTVETNPAHENMFFGLFSKEIGCSFGKVILVVWVRDALFIEAEFVKSHA
jgi:hypothetical protein